MKRLVLILLAVGIWSPVFQAQEGPTSRSYRIGPRDEIQIRVEELSDLDTTQTVWANALRARHDKWYASASHFVSYLLIMTPLAWYLSLRAGHRGEGLFEALILASVVSVSLLTTRFVILSRRIHVTPVSAA